MVLVCLPSCPFLSACWSVCLPPPPPPPLSLTVCLSLPSFLHVPPFFPPPSPCTPLCLSLFHSVLPLHNSLFRPSVCLGLSVSCIHLVNLSPRLTYTDALCRYRYAWGCTCMYTHLHSLSLSPSLSPLLSLSPPPLSLSLSSPLPSPLFLSLW